MLANELGEKALSYNPPFCYTMDSFLTNNGTSEHIVMGLGNGMIIRYKRKGLQVEELQGSVHNAQVSSLCIDPAQGSDILLSASNDLTFGIHQMNKEIKPV